MPEKPQLCRTFFAGYIYRPLVENAQQKNIFIVSQPKHMLWVFKRAVSMRRFF